MNRLFKNAKVFHDGGFSQENLATKDGRIISFDSDDCFAESDFTDCIIVPGFADVHVHFREPGFFYKESILSGSKAAAKGGYTAVCAMPNLDPPPDCVENLGRELEIIRRDAVIDVVPYGCITKGRQGKSLADLRAMAPYVAGFSDDGSGVDDKEVVRQAMLEAKALGKVIAAHCEVKELVDGGYINECEFQRVNGHKGISNASEYKMIERDLDLAKETGVKYHVCHVSAKESVSLIRQAKADGVDVTCETAPHYLCIDDGFLRDDGCFKMNPPLRSVKDREALTEGFCDGTIDMIATDHAPHSAQEKSKGLRGSAMGIVGLETAFPVLYTELVKRKIVSLERLIDAMCVAPRRRFGLKGGSLKAGEPADLTVIDLNASFVINPDLFLSKGRSTPFAGKEVFGKILLTLKNGRTVWKENTTKN